MTTIRLITQRGLRPKRAIIWIHNYSVNIAAEFVSSEYMNRNNIQETSGDRLSLAIVQGAPMCRVTLAAKPERLLKCSERSVENAAEDSFICYLVAACRRPVEDPGQYSCYARLP